jgi:hypothetical protein
VLDMALIFEKRALYKEFKNLEIMILVHFKERNKGINQVRTLHGLKKKKKNLSGRCSEFLVHFKKIWIIGISNK